MVDEVEVCSQQPMGLVVANKAAGRGDGTRSTITAGKSARRKEREEEKVLAVHI